VDQPQLQTVTDYVALLKRRKWVILAVLLILPATAFLWSETQSKLYAASADVLLTDIATGVQSPITTGDMSVMDTQQQVAASPAVAVRVLRATHLRNRTVEQIISEASFSPVGTSDVLRATVHDRDPRIARTLASAYAAQYSAYRRQLDRTLLETSRKEILGRMASLRASGEQATSLYATLSEKSQQLLAAEALETASAVVLRAAPPAHQVEPRPFRTAAIALLAGAVIAFFVAFLWDALDTRLRTGEDISTLLGLPLLGRLVAPPRQLRDGGGLVMFEDDSGPDSECFRILRTNLDLVNVDRSAKLILVTSALPGEGKSTTVANLGIALARAERRVVIVDLDLRRPTIAPLFGLSERLPGITDVLLGEVDLEAALQVVDVNVGRGSSVTPRRSLRVLPAGSLPPDPGEIGSSAAVRDLLAKLPETADVVLIDSPPLLGVAETIALGSVADAVVVLTRVGTASRPLLLEMRRVLDSLPAKKLGFVVTDAAHEEFDYRAQAYYYGYTPRGRSRVPKLPKRSAETSITHPAAGD
jgi:capsular exopolysaccharide synthesis family protein